MPARPRRALLTCSALLALSAGCGDTDGGSEPSAAEQARVIEERIEREREDAARSARQDERIKQLQRELEDRRERDRRTSPQAAAPAPAPAAPAASSPAPAPAAAPSPGSTGDWPGGSRYTVILTSASSEAAARQVQRRATAAGLDAGVLVSDGFRSLRPGYWVVFSGAFTDESRAGQRQGRARRLGFGDAYVRFVSE